MSPTSEKDLARRRKRLIDAGMRTWYGSRINDTTLAELVVCRHGCGAHAGEFALASCALAVPGEDEGACPQERFGTLG